VQSDRRRETRVPRRSPWLFPFLLRFARSQLFSPTTHTIGSQNTRNFATLLGCPPSRPERRLGLGEGVGHAAAGAIDGARSLFNHLISAQNYRWAYRKAERLGGLAVNDHLELCRKLHREIARLRAAQDAIDISSGANAAQ
jgi:hypothetical protein